MGLRMLSLQRGNTGNANLQTTVIQIATVIRRVAVVAVAVVAVQAAAGPHPTATRGLLLRVRQASYLSLMSSPCVVLASDIPSLSVYVRACACVRACVCVCV